MPRYEEHPEETVFKVVDKYNNQLSISHKPRIMAQLEESGVVVLQGRKYGVRIQLDEMKPLSKDEVARKIRQTCRRLARW